MTMLSHSRESGFALAMLILAVSAAPGHAQQGDAGRVLVIQGGTLIEQERLLVPDHRDLVPAALSERRPVPGTGALDTGQSEGKVSAPGFARARGGPVRAIRQLRSGETGASSGGL
jgi:hypothetical protein